MKLRKMKLFLCCLLVIAAVCAAGCAKAPQEGGAGEAGPGVPGGNFAERDTLSEAFAAEGNATVSLSGDETLDLTGITFTGRKEIFLNNASLRLIGVLTVSEEGVIDIKPGEGCRRASSICGSCALTSPGSRIPCPTRWPLSRSGPARRSSPRKPEAAYRSSSLRISSPS